MQLLPTGSTLVHPHLAFTTHTQEYTMCNFRLNFQQLPLAIAWIWSIFGSNKMEQMWLTPMVKLAFPQKREDPYQLGITY